MARAVTDRDRFLSKVDVSDSGCWLWSAAIMRNGYGHFAFQGTMKLAHRVSWFLFRGALPPGMVVCHTCDVRHCVNPQHLFLGTHKDNMRDAIVKGRPVGRPPRVMCFRGHDNWALKRRVRNGKATIRRHCATCAKRPAIQNEVYA